MYGRMSIARVLNGCTQALFRILLGVWPIVTGGLIIGNVTAQIIATAFLLISLKSVLSQIDFSRTNLPRIRELAKKYKAFPLFDAPARLIEIAIANLAIIVLAQFFEEKEIGCFSMVVTFV